MKLRGFFLFFLFCLIFGACTNDTPDKTTRTVEVTHPYPDSTNNSADPRNTPSPVGEADPKKEVTNIFTLNRSLWQNPIKVIQQMGDLEGKTVADIGAGPYGFFTLNIAAKSNVGKVLALDIDPEALAYIEKSKSLLPKEMGDKIETRKVAPDDPNLKEGEADIILVVNTAPYFDDRVDYFKKAKKGLPADGKIVVIDFKKRYTEGAGPPIDSRVPLGEIEQDLREAGYSNIKADDRSLEFQYIIIAGK